MKVSEDTVTRASQKAQKGEKIKFWHRCQTCRGKWVSSIWETQWVILASYNSPITSPYFKCCTIKSSNDAHTSAPLYSSTSTGESISRCCHFVNTKTYLTAQRRGGGRAEGTPAKSSTAWAQLLSSSDNEDITAVTGPLPFLQGLITPVCEGRGLQP